MLTQLPREEYANIPKLDNPPNVEAAAPQSLVVREESQHEHSRGGVDCHIMRGAIRPIRPNMSRRNEGSDVDLAEIASDWQTPQGDLALGRRSLNDLNHRSERKLH